MKSHQFMAWRFMLIYVPLFVWLMCVRDEKYRKLLPTNFIVASTAQKLQSAGNQRCICRASLKKLMEMWFMSAIFEILPSI
jgi:hypothetical protein